VNRYERYKWAGYDVVMAPAPYRLGEGPGSKSAPKGFLVVRVTQDSLQMAHHDATGWREVWAKPLKAKIQPTHETRAADTLSGP